MAQNPYRELGASLQQLRQELNLSQSDLGAIAHVSQPTVSRWEKGAACPDVLQWRAIEQGTGRKIFE